MQNLRLVGSWCAQVNDQHVYVVRSNDTFRAASSFRDFSSYARYLTTLTLKGRYISSQLYVVRTSAPYKCTQKVPSRHMQPLAHDFSTACLPLLSSYLNSVSQAILLTTDTSRPTSQGQLKFCQDCVV